MSTSTVRSTLDDLYRVEGKAELVNGRIERFMAAGDLPSLVAVEIVVRLREYARKVGVGKAYADGAGFAIPELPSGRESFSPDAAYYNGPHPANRMNFVDGPPTFAVEVRSKTDYGNAAEDQIAAKRADYFLAGTLIVWDVDPIAKTIAVYRSDAPDEPTVFGLGQIADAEPAVPGWRVSVDDVVNVD